MWSCPFYDGARVRRQLVPRPTAARSSYDSLLLIAQLFGEICPEVCAALMLTKCALELLDTFDVPGVEISINLCWDGDLLARRPHVLGQIEQNCEHCLIHELLTRAPEDFCDFCL